MARDSESPGAVNENERSPLHELVPRRGCADDADRTPNASLDKGLRATAIIRVCVSTHTVPDEATQESCTDDAT